MIKVQRAGVTQQAGIPTVSLMGEYQPERFLRYLDAAKINAGIESDAELARRMGKKQTPISMWRRHGTQPSTDLLDLAAEVLGVPARNLYVLAGHTVPGDNGKVDEVIMPSEIRALVQLYNDPGRTEEQRRLIRSHTQVTVTGLRTLFGGDAASFAAPRRRAG